MDLFYNPGAIILDLVKELVSQYIGSWVTDIAFGLFEDALGDIITDWLLNNSPDFIQDFFGFANILFAHMDVCCLDHIFFGFTRFAKFLISASHTFVSFGKQAIDCGGFPECLDCFGIMTLGGFYITDVIIVFGSFFILDQIIQNTQSS